MISLHPKQQSTVKLYKLQTTRSDWSESKAGAVTHWQHTWEQVRQRLHPAAVVDYSSVDCSYQRATLGESLRESTAVLVPTSA